MVFHLEDSAVAMDAARVTLKSGRVIDADLVVAGVACARAWHSPRPRASRWIAACR